MGHDPRVLRAFGTLASVLVCFGCSDDAGAPVSVVFRAVVGSEPYACGATYSGLGTGTADVAIRDFRMYVHDVSLVRSDGTAVPIALDESSLYQHSGVAFLDFSAKMDADCDDPTVETNTVVTGIIPEGAYDGVSFVVGIPFELNHADNAVAPAPLNVSSMYWDWNAGYKFVRIDGTTSEGDGEPRVHLGSTGCMADGSGGIASCTHENRPAISLDSFNPEGHTIAVDLAALFAGSNLDTNAATTAPGCMSEPDDPDCEPLFAALGLPFEGAPQTQTFFRVEAR
jgi:uncharacterized repeat protein (TIGR04052 family)